MNRETFRYGRITAIVVLFICAVLCFFGCTRQPYVSFSYEYEVESKTYRPGDTVQIRVVATNQGEPIDCGGPHNIYIDFFKKATLTTSTDSYSYSLVHNRISRDVQPSGTMFENGESVEYTYVFDLPDDAILGGYDFEFGFYNETNICIEDVIEVVE